MTWKTIMKVYKESQLMKEFMDWLVAVNAFDVIGKTSPIKHYNKFTIKGMWGYINCFADTKGIILHLNGGEVGHLTPGGYKVIAMDTDIKIRPVELRMLWCAKEFFGMQINHIITVQEVKDMRLKYSDAVTIAIYGNTKTNKTIKKIFKRPNSRFIAVYHNGVHILETMDIERAVKAYNVEVQE